MDFGNLKRLEPFCPLFGYTRGTPVMRYYIEKFLERHKECIRGRCLEFQDRQYTMQFGGNRVSKSDILNKDPLEAATIIADLTGPNQIPDDLFDTIICTQVLHIIAEPEYFLKELKRILAPGGHLLITVPEISMNQREYKELWRYTDFGIKTLLGSIYRGDVIETETYGNVFSACMNLMGMATEELEASDLDFADNRYGVIVGVKICKCAS